MKFVWTGLVCCLLMELEAEGLLVDQSAFLSNFVMQKVLKEGGNVFTPCRKAFFRMATQSNRSWAIKMFDASSKPGSGLLLGHRYWGGSRDLCLSAVAPSSNSFILGQGFRGRFCWINWEANIEGNEKLLSLPVTAAACVPDSCTPEDIVKFYPFVSPLISVVNPKAKAVTDMVKMKSVTCPEEATTLSKSTLMTLALLITITCLAILGTLQDIGFLDIRYQRTPEDKIYRSEELRDKKWIHQNELEAGSFSDFLLCFSLRRNAAAILNTEERDSKLSFLSGIRVLSICWILYGHGQSHMTYAEKLPLLC